MAHGFRCMSIYLPSQLLRRLTSTLCLAKNNRGSNFLEDLCLLSNVNLDQRYVSQPAFFQAFEREILREETRFQKDFCFLFLKWAEYCRARALGSAGAPGALKLGAPALPPLQEKIGSASAPGAPKNRER